jgi:hypothetical protein
VSSGSDLVINVGGRLVIQRSVLVTHEMSYSPRHTVLRSRRFDIVLLRVPGNVADFTYIPR